MFDPKPLGEAVACHTGGGTPPRQVPSYWGGGIPWASVKDFTEDEEQISSTQETISQKGLSASASNLIPAGTPLVCTRMAVGRAAMPSVPMAINQDVKALYPAAEVTPDYLLALLQYTQRFAEAQSVGSTVKGIRIQDYLAIAVPQAPAVEQPKIAEVLATLNKAIHQTEAIVEKLKQVKQGLVHDLLTRGVDANGELRPSYEEAAELYQESPLGWVPKEWDIGLLGNALIGIDAGWSPSCPEEPPSAGEWGVLKVSAVSGGVFQPAESKRLPHGLRPDPSIEVHPGNVILARANGVADLVATTVYVNSTPKGLMLSDKTLRLNPYPSKLSSRFLAALMHHPATRRQIGGMLNGSSGQKNISQSQIKALIVAIPSVNEQKTSEMLICDTEQRIRTEQMQVRKLKATREGLMDDLLTGRVRVTPLLAQ